MYIMYYLQRHQVVSHSKHWSKETALLLNTQKKKTLDVKTQLRALRTQQKTRKEQTHCQGSNCFVQDPVVTNSFIVVSGSNHRVSTTVVPLAG